MLLYRTGYFVLLLLLLLSTGCDSTDTNPYPVLVVQGFLEAGEPLPRITISRAVPLDEADRLGTEVPVEDATLQLTIEDRTIRYLPSLTSPGDYEPDVPGSQRVPPDIQFDLEINWQNQTARTADWVPTQISIDSMAIRIPEMPVSAILVDTLILDNPEVGAQRGFIYPIEVVLWWPATASASFQEQSYWVETRLRPQVDFSSEVLDVFLLTAEVQQETGVQQDTRSRHSWTGVYAVPVPDSLASVPDHTLVVQLLRSTDAYALFASSRDNPEQREPISNLDGAVGIVAGISQSTVELQIENSTVHIPFPLTP